MTKTIPPTLCGYLRPMAVGATIALVAQFFAPPSDSPGSVSHSLPNRLSDALWFLAAGALGGATLHGLRGWRGKGEVRDLGRWALAGTVFMQTISISDAIVQRSLAPLVVGLLLGVGIGLCGAFYVRLAESYGWMDGTQ